MISRVSPATRSRRRAKPSVRASVQRVLDNMAVPAVVLNAQQDLIAANLMGRALFPRTSRPTSRTWPGSSSSTPALGTSTSTGPLPAE